MFRGKKPTDTQKLQLRCSEAHTKDSIAEPISISSHTKHFFYQIEEIEMVKTQRGGFPEKEKSRRKEKNQDEALVYFY